MCLEAKKSNFVVGIFDSNRKFFYYKSRFFYFECLQNHEQPLPILTLLQTEWTFLKNFTYELKQFQSHDQGTHLSLDKVRRKNSLDPFHYIQIQNRNVCEVPHAVNFDRLENFEGLKIDVECWNVDANQTTISFRFL